MRLIVLLVGAGSFVMLLLSAFSRQAQIADAHVNDTSNAQPALDVTRGVLESGGEPLAIAIALGLAAAFALVVLGGWLGGAASR